MWGQDMEGVYSGSDDREAEERERERLCVFVQAIKAKQQCDTPNIKKISSSYQVQSQSDSN